MCSKWYEKLNNEIEELYVKEIFENGDIRIERYDTYEYSLRVDILEFVANTEEEDMIDEETLSDREYELLYRQIINRIARDYCIPFSWEAYRDVEWDFKNELGR